MPERSLFSRFLLLLLVVGIVAAAGVGWLLLRSGDPRYAAYELVFHSRFHQYDAVIEEVAKRRNMDPMLIKAVVWRESRFRPDKVGLDGERGLMQITDAAAGEWAKSEKVANFVPSDLFNPKTNIEAGTWLLARAVRRYQDRDDPVPFALAEYNAGRSRVARWAKEKEKESGVDTSPATNSKELQANIDIPGTKSYVATVLGRARYYHDRGRL